MEIGPKTQPVGCSLPRGLLPRALDAGFARGFLVLSIFLRKVCSTAPARWSDLYIRAHLRKVGPEQTKRILPRTHRWSRLFRGGMWSVSRGVAQREKCRASLVPVLMVGAVQGMAGPWGSGAGFLTENVGTAVGADVGPYQAQIRKPSGPAHILPREVGFVQAAVGTCALAGRFL